LQLSKSWPPLLQPLISILYAVVRVLFAAAYFLFATSREDKSSERLPGGLGSLVMALFDTGLVAGIRKAARQLTGATKRNWFAWACRTYAGGSPRAAETIFGWNRKAVARGLGESHATAAEVVAPDVEKKLSVH
jgi:hypothetical protein